MATIKVGDLNIGYQERGAGEAIVFLHGVGSDISTWDEQLNYFSEMWRAVALEYPGYGASDLPAKGLSRRDIAHYLFGAMDGLTINTAHMVGLSMGGVMCLEMALQQPARLRSLTLVDTFAYHPNGSVILKNLHKDISAMPMLEFARSRVGLIVSPGASGSVKQEVIRTMAKIAKETYRWSTRAVWTSDYRRDLPHITIPALVAIGEHDQLTPKVLSEALHRGIAGSKLVVIPGAGHLSNLENPAFFDRMVEDFILSVE
jgi:3-oxoadipate enol-lactonase